MDLRKLFVSLGGRRNTYHAPDFDESEPQVGPVPSPAPKASNPSTRAQTTGPGMNSGGVVTLQADKPQSSAASLSKKYSFSMSGATSAPAIKKGAESTNSLLLSAVAVHKQGKLEEAEALYLNLLRKDPNIAEALQYLGMLESQRGRLEQGIVYLQQALAISPQHFAALSNLGTALMQAQLLEPALAQFELALKVKPDSDQVWHNRANVLLGLGRYADACESYKRALEINPKFVDASRELSKLLLLSGQPADAISVTDNTLRLVPNAAGLHYIRGAALCSLDRFREALVSLDQALEFTPNLAGALNEKGWALNRMHQYQEALVALDKALALNDKLPEANNRRAFALMKLERVQEALLGFDGELELNPTHAEALSNKASLLELLGRGEEAREALTRAKQFQQDNLQHPFKHAIAWIPTVRDKTDNLDVVRAHFAAEIEALLDRVNAGPVDSPAEVVGAARPFYLAYQARNNKSLLSLYGTLCQRLMQQWCDQQAPSPTIAGLRSGSGRRRVGIVSGHIRDHSVWRAIVRGWVCELDRSRFDVCVFSLDDRRDSETELAEQQATEFVSGERSLEDWVQCLQDAKLDVLLYPELGMDPLTPQLASLRLAPIQIASWGHPETTGIPTVDYYLSAELFESVESDEDYSERLVRLPHLGCCVDKSDVQPEAVELQSLGVRADATLFVCAGTPYKYTPEHDWTFARIAQQVDTAQFLFFSNAMTASLTARVLERIGKTFEAQGMDPNKHLVVCDWQTPARFYSVLSQAHVFLDTIDFSGFNTVMQAVDSAIPIVTQRGKFMRGCFGSAIMRRLGMGELVCENDDDFVTLAVRFALDAPARERTRSLIVAQRHMLYGDLLPIRAMENFLTSL